MTDRYIISDDDILLMFNTTRSGEVYVSDSTGLGKTYTLDMLLDQPGDNCPRILILNTKTLKSSDVTEMFATAWLKRAHKADELDVDEDFTAEDLEAGFPDFVKNSRAWADWKSDIEADLPYLLPKGHAARVAAYVDAGRPVREEVGA